MQNKINCKIKTNNHGESIAIECHANMVKKALTWPLSRNIIK